MYYLRAWSPRTERSGFNQRFPLLVSGLLEALGFEVVVKRLEPVRVGFLGLGLSFEGLALKKTATESNKGIRRGAYPPTDRNLSSSTTGP